jgi:hypothetical protein
MRLAGALQRPVVAEGVETIEIALMLLHTCCDFAQGYGIARPMPALLFPLWLRDWETSNGVWHALSQSVRLDVPHYDLNIAIFSHQRWVDSVIKWLTLRPDSTLPEADAGRCSLSRWYHGIGRQRYGGHASYAFIPPRHAHVHDLANALVRAAQDGDEVATPPLVVELRAASEELIHLVDALRV